MRAGWVLLLPWFRGEAIFFLEKEFRPLSNPSIVCMTAMFFRFWRANLRQRTDIVWLAKLRDVLGYRGEAPKSVNAMPARRSPGS